MEDEIRGGAPSIAHGPGASNLPPYGASQSTPSALPYSVQWVSGQESRLCRSPGKFRHDVSDYSKSYDRYIQKVLQEWNHKVATRMESSCHQNMSNSPDSRGFHRLIGSVEISYGVAGGEMTSSPGWLCASSSSALRILAASDPVRLSDWLNLLVKRC